MVMWHVDRVVVPYSGPVLPECDTDGVAVEYHLIDLDTQAIATDVVCTGPGAVGAGRALLILQDAGFVPNDFGV